VLAAGTNQVDITTQIAEKPIFYEGRKVTQFVTFAVTIRRSLLSIIEGETCNNLRRAAGNYLRKGTF